MNVVVTPSAATASTSAATTSAAIPRRRAEGSVAMPTSSETAPRGSAVPPHDRAVGVLGDGHHGVPGADLVRHERVGPGIARGLLVLALAHAGLPHRGARVREADHDRRLGGGQLVVVGVEQAHADARDGRRGQRPAEHEQREALDLQARGARGRLGRRRRLDHPLELLAQAELALAGEDAPRRPPS